MVFWATIRRIPGKLFENCRQKEPSGDKNHVTELPLLTYACLQADFKPFCACIMVSLHSQVPPQHSWCSVVARAALTLLISFPACQTREQSTISPLPTTKICSKPSPVNSYFDSHSMLLNWGLGTWFFFPLLLKRYFSEEENNENQHKVMHCYVSCMWKSK